MKIYGPYTRRDGRKHILIYRDDGTRTTQSYPRYLMEQHLGRQLLPEETVDHIDGDFTNDDLTNLQLLSLADNIRKDHSSTEYVDCICPECGKEFREEARWIRHNQQKQGKLGPFCGKSCAGKHSRRRQLARL